MSKFAKFINQNKIELAPKILILGPKKYIANPLPKHYLKAGYLELIDEHPAEEEGYIWTNKHYSKKSGKIYAVWDKEKLEDEPMAEEPVEPGEVEDGSEEA